LLTGDGGWTGGVGGAVVTAKKRKFVDPVAGTEVMFAVGTRAPGVAAAPPVHMSRIFSDQFGNAFPRS